MSTRKHQQNPAVVHEFVAAEHPEYGSMGWRSKHVYDFDPLPGMAVAHDILEHFADTTANADDEFQAFGSILYVRGLGGYFSRKSRYSPGSNLASDVPEIARHVVHGEATMKAAPKKTKPLSVEVEGWIAEALREGRRECVEQFDDPDDMAVIDEMLKQAVDWIRIGFRRAEKRFQKAGLHGRRASEEICQLFEYIEQEADRYLKTVEGGEELRVVVNISKRQATVTMTYPWEMVGDDDDEA